MTFDEAVAKFKAEARPEDALLLIPEDKRDSRTRNLQKIVLAWPRITIERTKIQEKQLGDGNALWSRLWEQVTWDEEEIVEKAGLPGSPAKLIEQLIGNRLIYPDGTVSEIATKVLKSLLKAKLNI